MELQYTLYSGTGCPACVNLKTKMDEAGLKYNEVNIRESELAMQFLQEEGHRTIPQVYTFDGKYVPVQEIKELCNAKQES